MPVLCRPAELQNSAFGNHVNTGSAPMWPRVAGRLPVGKTGRHTLAPRLPGQGARLHALISACLRPISCGQTPAPTALAGSS